MYETEDSPKVKNNETDQDPGFDVVATFRGRFTTTNDTTTAATIECTEKYEL